MAIKHGIYIQEEATAVTVPKTGSSSVQVIVGTAPVNMAEDPAAAVNVPILANSAKEAETKLGYSSDFSKFTLCQSMYLVANAFPVSPIVFINVLDPAKHTKDIASKSYQVNKKQFTIEEEGVLRDTVTVKSGTDTTGTYGTDYTVSFDAETGYAVVTLVAGGKLADATTVTAAATALDPAKVTKTDIIGAVDPDTGKETGIQVIRQVYPKLGIVPGIILAPGWSQIPEVGLARIHFSVQCVLLALQPNRRVHLRKECGRSLPEAVPRRRKRRRTVRKPVQPYDGNNRRVPRRRNRGSA